MLLLPLTVAAVWQRQFSVFCHLGTLQSASLVGARVQQQSSGQQTVVAAWQQQLRSFGGGSPLTIVQLGP